jgi:hypothetical protein
MIGQADEKIPTERDNGGTIETGFVQNTVSFE